MESVLRLDQHMQVELEGWLLKRGAGFNNDGSEDVEITRSKVPFSLAPLDNLLFGRTSRSRYFVLVKNDEVREGMPNPSATIYYFVKAPKIIKARKHEEIKLLQAKETDSRHAKGFPQPVNVRRGEIKLAPDTGITLKDGVIKLVCTGRTYYLSSIEDNRDKGEIVYTVGRWYEGIRKLITWLGTMHLRRSRLSTTANLDHLKRLSTAFQRNSVRHPHLLSRSSTVHTASEVEDEIPQSLRLVLDGAFYRKEFNDYLGFSHATENLEFHDKVEEFKDQFERLKKVRETENTNFAEFAQSICNDFIVEGAPKQVNISSEQRRRVLAAVAAAGEAITPTLFAEAQQEVYLLMETNFFQRFQRDLLKRTGCFASLFLQCGLSGYEAVVQNHFGSVMSETERLHAMYTARMEGVVKQIEVLRESLKFSHEVAVTEFKSLRQTLRTAYNATIVRLQALVLFQSELQENCLKKLNDLLYTLNRVLSELLAGDAKRIADWKDLVEYQKRQTDIERTVTMHSRMVDQNAETLEKANEDLAKFRIKITASYTFEKALKSAQENAEAATREERSAYRELSEELSETLNNLEKLDLHRLGVQKEVMQTVCVAEHDLFRTTCEDVALSGPLINSINVKNDMERLARKTNERLADRLLDDASFIV